MSEASTFRVLVYGGKGWIGRMFEETMKTQCWHIIHSTCRIGFSTLNDVEAELDFVMPDRVLCFVGKTRSGTCATIDALEGSREALQTNLGSNLFAPLWLSLSCEARNIHFTYFGTGCIFETDEKSPKRFTEEDTPNFFGSDYSLVKGFTDVLMHHGTLATNTLNVRIRMPIVSYPHPFNFITKITKYAKVINEPNSMSVMSTLFPVLADMMERKFTGTINLVNPGCISHNEVLDMYTDFVDPTFTYENFTVEAQDAILKSRRSNNVLDTSRLRSLYPDVPSIRKAVETALREMGKTMPK